uniref:Microsomal glutathione S-transferase 1 n=1 Tax=Timema poppense TaxID=170557 RepID=A0A7R9DNV8_TIMPO|nr:unnamed protein product [Timema poppensis]
MVDNIMDMFSTTNPVFRAYLFYSAVLVVKMLAMSLLTARQRFKHKVFANPEDAAGKGAKVRFDNTDIERVRR